MIKFKPLEISDKLKIDKFVKNSGSIGSEYPFATNFLWRNFYKLELAVDPNFYSLYSDRGNEYLFPLIDSNNNDYNNKLKDIIIKLKENATYRGIRLKIYGVTDYNKETLENIFPDMFEFKLIPGVADYIYNISDFVKLHGAKYKEKRRQINSFNKNYCDWEYKTLDKFMFDDCFKVNEEWYNNSQNYSSHGMLEHEYNMLKIALTYYKELDLFGRVILLDGVVIGFNIACKINDKVIDLIIEKSMTKYKEVYSILLQNFSKDLQNMGISYMNREEDMDIPNLRKSKMALHPYKILNKYEALMLNLS